jgi:prolyl oligopeptidase
MRTRYLLTTVRRISLTLALAPTIALAQGAQFAEGASNGTDRFRWMESDSGGRTSVWIAGQDSAARRFMATAPGRAVLRSTLTMRLMRRVFSPPFRRGALEFFSVRHGTGPGAQREWRARPAGMTDTGRTLIGSTEVRGAQSFTPSPDGSQIAVIRAAVGSNWGQLSLVRSGDGQERVAALAGLYRSQGGLAWWRGGSSILAVQSDNAQNGVPVRHRVVDFNPQTGRTTTVAGPFADDASVQVAVAADAAGSAVVVVRRPDQSTDAIQVIGPGGKASRATVEGVPAGTITIGGIDGQLAYFIHWGNGAERGAVAAVPVAEAAPRWRVIIPQDSQPISTWPGVGLALTLPGLLVTRLDEDGTHRPMVYARDGSGARAIDFPYRGALWSGFVAEPWSSSVRFQLSGLTDPGSVHELDLATGAHTVLRFGVEHTPPESVVVERRWIEARDGTSLPLDVVRLPDTPLDGSAPIAVYGYGFGAWMAAPWFQPMMAEWVARGGVWAVAGLRGDGVGGEVWHRAGIRRNKRTGVHDFLDVITDLQRSGIARPDRTIANGSSAGAPLVAAAVLTAPQQFAAAILDYGVFDMLRYHLHGHGAQWEAEFGVASDTADVAVLQRWSPLVLAESAACGPWFILSPGELDRTAPMWHSAKLAATLTARETCRERTLLRVTWGAGHNAGNTSADAIATWVDQLSALRRLLPEGTLRWP